MTRVYYDAASRRESHFFHLGAAGRNAAHFSTSMTLHEHAHCALAVPVQILDDLVRRLAVIIE